ncbi:helix-turn-helix transcriptional regulator [Serratia sp. UGAL515B_01]|uniref:helix-turn-helix domain-containing protein n=1 Tax=Serratia sp. UGAL515B_01 TaxID=2986763 RepID=UPI002952A47B|nr:helix-turn-helix transcriptional regulator [Serratia sp. UGAL515B_01]WON75513.1 helix-turn-helix domain-containing protein [Serratia sp. UGAL515B_01]
MKNVIHPSIIELKKIIRAKKIRYSDIARKMNVSEQRIKDIFSGRIEINGLWERDSLCEACGVSPVDVLLQRLTEQEKAELLSLKMLTEQQRYAILFTYKSFFDLNVLQENNSV